MTTPPTPFEGRISVHDESIPDSIWWFSPWAEFEDFVGLGRPRVRQLAKALKGKVSPYFINRLLKANGLPHGPTNTTEEVI